MSVSVCVCGSFPIYSLISFTGVNDFESGSEIFDCVCFFVCVHVSTHACTPVSWYVRACV